MQARQRPHNQARPTRHRSVRRPHGCHLRRAIAPRRLGMQILVGVLTLVSVDAWLQPTAFWEAGAARVYAEQRVSESPAITAPALSAAPAATTTRSASATSVLTDLGASIGRTSAPGPAVWRGMVGQEVNKRPEPNRSKPPVGKLAAGAPVEVKRWVTGEEIESHNDTWAELADGTYVFSTSLRRSTPSAPPALPADAPTEGTWVDVNLTEQVATAYNGRVVQRIALVSTGRPGWDTPTGSFPVLRRVEKDTMDGSTLIGQGPGGAGADYKVENVRYVQYFTQDGAAIHENYWRRPATFGMPGSHGCIGMAPADAAWFWSFATVGTPLVIHN